MLHTHTSRLLGITILTAVAAWLMLSRQRESTATEQIVATPSTKAGDRHDSHSGRAVPSRDAALPGGDTASLSLEQILTLTEPTHRLEELTDRALAVPREQIPDVLAHLPASLLESDYAAILVRRWTEDAPEDAARWASGLPAGGTRDKLLSASIGAWAEDDPASARKWLAGQGNPEERERLSHVIAHAAVDSHPLEALTIACELPDTAAREDLINACLRQWSATMPEDAAAWVMELPDVMARQRAFAEIAATWAGSDPIAASELATSHLADNEALKRAILGIVANASKSNPELIRGWIDRFPEEALKDSARAEFTRIELGLLPSPKSLPGEDVENRTPSTPH